MSSESIKQNLRQVVDNIEVALEKSGRPAGSARLLPVTKTVSDQEVMALYEEGMRCFGENRLPPLEQKVGTCPKDIDWHYIGQLQRNKVRKILGFCDILHAVDSFRLAKRISDIAVELDKTVKIFVELNGGETQKGGVAPDDLVGIVGQVVQLPNIEIQGLMVMAPFSADEAEIRKVFSSTRKAQEALNRQGIAPSPLKALSMGMSNDYIIAIEEGSTLVRVGSALFA